VSPPLTLQWRPFRFVLPRALVTAHGAVEERAGWLLRLAAADGRLGWGEAAPLAPGPARREGEADAGGAQACRAAIAALGPLRTAPELEDALPSLPAPLAFALGAALAELQGLVGVAPQGWRAAPPPAWLLPAGEAMLPALEQVLAAVIPEGLERTSRSAAHPLCRDAPGPRAEAPGPQACLPPVGPGQQPGSRFSSGGGLTVKWKVAAAPDLQERQLLEQLLEHLPSGARLRLDANGGWDRPTASAWADRLAGEPRLEWLEQPLPPRDQEGLEALAQRLPVALDESLRADPALRARWPGWQVRRPALEGDPRPLLAELRSGRPWLMVSTALETGIGRRWVHHLAALQAAGPTPAAPGLAPGWTPVGPLVAQDPAVVWEAVA
jgi:O-succinylbenzoate synthase